MSVENTLYRRLVDIFHQSAFAEIQNPDSKLRTQYFEDENWVRKLPN